MEHEKVFLRGWVLLARESVSHATPYSVPISHLSGIRKSPDGIPRLTTSHFLPSHVLVRSRQCRVEEMSRQHLAHVLDGVAFRTMPLSMRSSHV